jgi:hypothetical protein
MNKIFFVILLVFITGFLHSLDSSGDSAKIDKLEKRIEALEQKNNDLEMELEETKRNIADNSGDATGDLNKVAIQKDQWGREFAFEFSGGLSGVYTQFNVGILFPKIKNSMIIGLGVNTLVSLIPMIKFDKTKDDINSYFYSIISVYFKFGGTSPLFFNFIRVYGYGEFIIGARIQNQEMDIYKNNVTISFGGFGFGGIEFYTSRWCAIFIEAGGGYIGFVTLENENVKDIKNVKVETENGSNGFAFNIGVKIFLAKKKKK